MTELPTEEMVVAGFEAVAMFHDTEQYEAMSGCQGAAESARICWAAMVAEIPEGDEPRQDRMPSEAVIAAMWKEAHFARTGEEARSKFVEILLRRYGNAAVRMQRGAMGVGNW